MQMALPSVLWGPRVDTRHLNRYKGHVSQEVCLNRRTLLIGLDGATFSVLDPLMDQGVMPFLEGFLQEGARASLRSVVPPLTPPAWTSLVTGRSPGNHGIFDFFLKEEKSPYIRFATSADVPCETIWSLASRSGCRVTVLNFPLMLPPPKVNGHVISGGWMTARQLRLGCHPEGLYDKLKALAGFDPRRLVLSLADEEKALEGCDPAEYDEWIRMHIEREEQWFRIASHLMREEPSDLTAVLFDGVDKIQHLCWRFIRPEDAGRPLTPREEETRAWCLRYFARLDEILAGLVELAGEEAAVFLASDHGFGPQRETFFVNAWLAEQGALFWAAPERPREDANAVLGMRQLARHVSMFDWERTRAYAATPSSNGIHIVAARDGRAGGIPAAEYEPFRDELVRRLAAVRSPSTGKAMIEKVWTREEAFAGPFLSRAPDLTLYLWDGGLVSILDSDSVVKPRATPAGTHRPEGVFMARGPGIRPGLRTEEISILDVAPMILHSLGLSIPQDMEGRVAEAFYLSPYWERHPPAFQAPAGQEAHPKKGVGDRLLFDAEAEAEMAARLRALGYIE